MKTLALILAICLPLAASVFIARRKDAKTWQHYALLTVLTIYVSILLLGVSGNLASFGYGDAKVEFVSQKVEEAKKLLEQLRNLANTTAELSALATQPRPIGRLQASVDYDREIRYYTTAKQKISELLKQAGRSENEIEKVVEPLTKEIQLLEVERAQEGKPKK